MNKVLVGLLCFLFILLPRSCPSCPSHRQPCWGHFFCPSICCLAVEKACMVPERLVPRSKFKHWLYYRRCWFALSCIIMDDFMRNAFAEQKVFKRVSHCHDWGFHSCHAAFINMPSRSRSCSSCSSCPSAVAWPTLLLQLLRQWKRWRQQMQRWFKATRLWLRMARTKSLQSLLGMTAVIKSIQAGDDQAVQAAPAVPAVPAAPAVQAEGALVPAGENPVARSMRQEIAEGVMAAVGSTPFHLRMDDAMLLEQEEVQRHAIALPQAPSIFWIPRVTSPGLFSASTLCWTASTRTGSRTVRPSKPSAQVLGCLKCKFFFLPK